MNAKESRKFADEFNAEKHKTQKEDVYALIDSIRKVGGYNCSWYETLKDAVVAELEMDGYVVETSSHRNEITVTISW